MIAADTSSLVAFLAGKNDADTAAIAAGFSERALYLPPPVLVELIGRPQDEPYIADLVAEASILVVRDGMWLRARACRRLLLSKGLRARGMDALIAQCCIDADVALITRDGGFRHFERWCGLKLAV